MKLIPDLVTFEAEVLKHKGTVLVDFYLLSWIDSIR